MGVTGRTGGGDQSRTSERDPFADAPASGAWWVGDEPGDRQFATLFVDRPLALEFGGSIGPIEVAYETWGQPRADNAVLVCHALTGDSHLDGPIGPGHPSPGWWPGITGPGAALDSTEWFVVCPNVLGGCQGTTGPASRQPDGRRWAGRFPTLTLRDQVAVEAALADHLGIERWAAVIGGSLGGMRSLEWAVGHPQRVQRAIVVATNAAATAEQIALSAIQSAAIRLDPGFRGGDYYDAPPGAGPARGLGNARRLAHLSYRSPQELSERFGRSPQGDEDPGGGGRYAIESYLDHQAVKLARRFDANSYLVLTRAMDHHDLGRGRCGVAAALAAVTAAVTVGGVDSDRLYPLSQQRDLAAGLRGRPEVQVMHSTAGHDGFLVEATQINRLVACALGA